MSGYEGDMVMDGQISDEECNVLVDSPESIAAIQTMADLVHKDKCP